METTIKKINGYSVQDIVEKVQSIQADPEIAKFKFRVKNTWLKGGLNETHIQGFYGGKEEDTSRKEPFVYFNSEPPILLGNNEAANPVEFILHGLAGCMTTTMTLHAAAHGIAVEHIESMLEGDIDLRGFLGLSDKVRKGYQQIRVSFNIKGNLTTEEKEKLESFAKNSPVFDIVTNPVPVSLVFRY